MLDDDTVSLSLGEGSPFLIVDRLIRDNYKVFVRNYPTSLIGGGLIRENRALSFNTGSLGCLYYQPFEGVSWPPVLGLYLGLSSRAEQFHWACPPNLLFKPDIWACVLGLCAYYFKPNQLPPSPWLTRAWVRAVSFLGSGATSTWLLGDGLIRA